ncbi:hypothetical protein BWI97_02850 [Siphonobacter sp. BAB-5405]|uniref:PAS domain S-box protein n=1 Tax=Siphonobacter sp. BAB-5405 TaxID=1864825 RepID=UPI000C805A47|nr:PAS domain S-box protein [Siphonobacter sp. BAB-5405]PMD98766.1 hypothetical protein BWI97_02850 [Siphonobacter sp. BAB-5405]
MQHTQESNPEEKRTRAVDDFMWEWNREDGDVWWSEGYAARVGFPEEPTLASGAYWHSRIHPDDQVWVSESLQQALQKRQNAWDTTYRFQKADGSYIIVKDQAHLIWKGEAVRLLGTSTVQNEALYRSTQFYLAAFDQVPLGMIVTDANGQIVRANASFQQLSGYTAAELQQLSYRQLIYPADLPVYNARLESLQTNSSTQLESRLRRNNGQVLWVKQTITRIPELGYYFTTVEDITHEHLHRQQRERLLTLVENSSELMVIAGMDDQLLYINQAGRELVGLPAEVSLSHRKVSDFYWQDQYAFVRETILPALIEKGHWKGEFSIRHFQTGAAIPVFASGIRIDDPDTGKPIARGFTLRDMRPEELARQTILESERHFRNLVMQAPVAIGLLKGRKMVIETANEFMLEVWGKTESIVGKPLLSALPELAGQGFIELLQDVYDTGNPFYGNEILAQIIRNNRLEARYYNFVYAPVRQSDGTITGVMIVANDVSDQVRAKKEVQFSEERFRSFVLGSPTPIAIYTGKELRIETVNQAMLDTWHRDGSLVGKTFREAFPELDPQHFYQLLEQVYETGRTYNAQEDRADLLIDGEFRTFYFNFTYKALRDARGEVYGIINTATDVTAQVNARQQLEETEQNLRDAIELAELGTWSRNLNTGKIRCSSRIRQWYGFAESETDIETFMAAVHPEDRHQVLDMISQAVAFRKSDHYSAEYRVVHLQTGEERMVQSQGKVTCDPQGKPYLLSGTSRDVTSQKQAALGLERLVSQRTRELQQANELLQLSNRELEQYAYVASHDLQEPLRKIRMFSGIIREMNDLPEQARSPLAKVIHSSERMTLLIRDLLEFSRLLKVDRVLTPTNLNTIVQNVITDFELAIQEKSATVEVSTLPTVNAESLQMNQLFYNLLSNALKFTKEGVPPRISITCERLIPQKVQAYALPEGAYYDIRIDDNGIGFSENYKEQIFEVFKRLHTREVYPGSGIGLALCRKIVQNHGGLLYAESEEGQGSTFHVILPDPSEAFRSASVSF